MTRGERFPDRYREARERIELARADATNGRNILDRSPVRSPGTQRAITQFELAIADLENAIRNLDREEALPCD